MQKAKTFKRYTGKEPYIFASFDKDDSARIMPILKKWHTKGYRVSYTAHSKDDHNNDLMKNCSRLVIFLSPNALEDSAVYEELTYALQKQLPIDCVELDKTEIPMEIELNKSSINLIPYYRTPPELFAIKSTEKFGSELLYKQIDDEDSERLSIEKLRKTSPKYQAFAIASVMALLLVIGFFSNGIDEKGKNRKLASKDGVHRSESTTKQTESTAEAETNQNEHLDGAQAAKKSSSDQVASSVSDDSNSSSGDFDPAAGVSAAIANSTKAGQNSQSIEQKEQQLSSTNPEQKKQDSDKKESLAEIKKMKKLEQKCEREEQLIAKLSNNYFNKSDSQQKISQKKSTECNEFADKDQNINLEDSVSQVRVN